MIDELWENGPVFDNSDDIFKPGLDSILLANFINGNKKKNQAIIDLGCGSGIIPIILAWNNPTYRVDGIEIQSKAAQLAINNAYQNALHEKITIINADIRDHRKLMKPGQYDIVLSNPPYRQKGSGKSAKNTNIALSRFEETCTLSDICVAAGYFVRWGGSLYLVHLPERLPEIIRTLHENGFEPKRLRFVHQIVKSRPNLILIESRKGGRPSLQVEPILVLKNEDGSDSAEMRTVYRR